MSVPTEPTIEFAVLFDIVSVPTPLSVTFAAPIISSVVFPIEFSDIAPALLIVVPLTVSDVPLLKSRLSVLSPSVRFAAVAPAMLSETAEFAVLMQVLLLLCTPPVQLAATFQFPAAPPCQLVTHCANAENGHNSSAITASSGIRAEHCSRPKCFFSAKNGEGMALSVLRGTCLPHLKINYDKNGSQLDLRSTHYNCDLVESS